MEAVTFKMYVSPKGAKFLQQALTDVKANKQISAYNNVPVHTVEWDTLEESDTERTKYGARIWFTISVSRPFLIFEVGRVYQQFIIWEKV